MTSSFFRSLLSSLLLVGALPLLGQAPATPVPGATPKPEEKKPREGYVRFWNLLPKEAGELRLMRETGTEDPEAFSSAAPGNTYASYLPVKPGRYILQVTREADPKNILKRFDLTLKADVFVTFVARIVDRQLNIEMVDDTYDRANTPDGRLTIRHEMPGATINVSAGSLVGARGMIYGQIEQLTGFSTGKPTMLKMNAVMPDGQKRDWTMEVNFAACRHVTLLLALDPYGRFRPRISPEGQLEISAPVVEP